MNRLVEKRFHALGRACHIVVGDLNGRGPALLELAIGELRRIEGRLGAHRQGSLVHAFNHSLSPSTSAAIDGEVRQLLEYISAIREKTNNVFDPSIVCVDKLWRSTAPLPPTDQAIQTALTMTGWHHVRHDGNSLRSDTSELMLNLDSCICPYVVDSLRRLLLREGVTSALIDLDRDVGTIGRQPDGANWLVGIRYPHGSRTAIHRMKLNNACYSQRGNFERRLMINGEHFGQAFSPADGYPIPGPLSVAVAAPQALEACAAATVARFRAEQEALDWLSALNLPWLSIDRSRGCHGPLARSAGLSSAR
ncbi:FAD:protein FMN transferase [Parahaliea mediterranea]|uniref:FAD:protein FMN transferase n=1 Tax=Parahaliea mediterranea TaxID=651086 RepID=A0A939IKN6_9GAMM|nr:FAD:protein FMN transferase [Parahaliea mediterranea]MBN7795123.1 FAD:protein FMN transferase [Parahaliea mediterranea]